MRIKYLILFTLVVALQLSCGVKKGKENAERAVEKFHSQLNAGQFQQIYSESDEAFRKAVTEEQALQLFDAVHRKLGTVQQAKLTGWHVNATTGGTAVTLGYDVDFSEGKGTEQFVYHVSGDKALLFNYNVNSPLLITK
ncbi:MAG TPA: DUF3887 domain-containing protein [Pyrinomonadaceae bacterium]|nr:DUF3887 domain-containing protein [Pyrinomonadaceae bacterium]